jgi:HEAT repeat protein
MIPSVLDFWSPGLRRMERRRDIASIIDVLRTGSPRARRTAANTLIRHPDPRSVDALAGEVSSDDPLLRRNVAIALGEIRDTGSGREAATINASLIRVLGDEDASVRTMAAASLGRTRPSEALLPLIGLLEDPEPSVRKIATVVLRGYDDPRAAEALSS